MTSLNFSPTVWTFSSQAHVWFFTLTSLHITVKRNRNIEPLWNLSIFSPLKKTSSRKYSRCFINIRKYIIGSLSRSRAASRRPVFTSVPLASAGLCPTISKQCRIDEGHGAKTFPCSSVYFRASLREVVCRQQVACAATRGTKGSKLERDTLGIRTRTVHPVSVVYLWGSEGVTSSFLLCLLVFLG